MVISNNNPKHKHRGVLISRAQLRTPFCKVPIQKVDFCSIAFVNRVEFKLQENVLDQFSFERIAGKVRIRTDTHFFEYPGPVGANGGSTQG